LPKIKRSRGGERREENFIWRTHTIKYRFSLREKGVRLCHQRKKKVALQKLAPTSIGKGKRRKQTLHKRISTVETSGEKEIAKG